MSFPASETIIFVLTFFWLAHILRRTLFFLYFWQLKEYRWDRFFSALSERKTIVLQKILIVPGILLILVLLMPIGIYSRLWEIVALVYYFLFGIFSLAQLFFGKWRFPKLTIKMLGLAILFLAAGIFSASVFLASALATNLLIYALALDVFLAVFIAFGVMAFQIPVSLVKKTFEWRAHRRIKGMKGLMVVGITGSYGKTSTKSFLFSLLSSKYKCLKTEGNINSEIGIAKYILKNLKKEHQIFICEMGAYNVGHIWNICKMVNPKIGILTGINQQHLALFGSQENIIKAKFELIKALPKDGVAIANWDSENIKNNFQSFAGGVKARLCSTYEKVDIWAENIAVGTEKITFLVCSKNEKPSEFMLNLAGRQNIINFLMALACGQELGLRISEIASASRAITPEQGGIKLHKSKNGFSIINSSYSANPDGALAALEYIKIWPNKKIIVMPSLIELGLVAKEIHKKIGGKISETCDLAIITTKEHFNDVREGAFQKEKIILIQDAKEIAEKIKEFCFEGDVVLLEGRVPFGLLELLI